MNELNFFSILMLMLQRKDEINYVRAMVGSCPPNNYISGVKVFIC